MALRTSPSAAEAFNYLEQAQRESQHDYKIDYLPVLEATAAPYLDGIEQAVGGKVEHDTRERKDQYLNHDCPPVLFR